LFARNLTLTLRKSYTVGIVLELNEKQTCRITFSVNIRNLDISEEEESILLGYDATPTINIC